MAIYLDTSALPWHGELDGPEIFAVRAVAAEYGQQVVLPALVPDESTANRRREIERAFLDIEQRISKASWALPKWRRSFDLDDPSAVANSWRSQLPEWFVHVALSGENAREALRREVERIPPAHAKEGRGARDAAIWLTVRDHHLAGNEVGYFVSRNKADFAGAGGVELHPYLADEVKDHPRTLHYLSDTAQLLDLLAADPVPVTLEQLRNDSTLHRSVFTNVPKHPTSWALIERLAGEVALPLPTDARGAQIITKESELSLRELGVVRAHTFQDGRAVAVLQSAWEVLSHVDVSVSRDDAVLAQQESLLRQRLFVQIWGKKTSRNEEYEWEVSHVRAVGPPEVVNLQ